MSVGMVDDGMRKILNRLDNGRVESNPTYGGPSLEQVPGTGQLRAKSAYSETSSRQSGYGHQISFVPTEMCR